MLIKVELTYLFLYLYLFTFVMCPSLYSSRTQCCCCFLILWVCICGNFNLSSSPIFSIIPIAFASDENVNILKTNWLLIFQLCRIKTLVCSAPYAIQMAEVVAFYITTGMNTLPRMRENMSERDERWDAEGTYCTVAHSSWIGIMRERDTHDNFTWFWNNYGDLERNYSTLVMKQTDKLEIREQEIQNILGCWCQQHVSYLGKNKTPWAG